MSDLTVTASTSDLHDMNPKPSDNDYKVTSRSATLPVSSRSKSRSSSFFRRKKRTYNNESTNQEQRPTKNKKSLREHIKLLMFWKKKKPSKNSAPDSHLNSSSDVCSELSPKDKSTSPANVSSCSHHALTPAEKEALKKEWFLAGSNTTQVVSDQNNWSLPIKSKQSDVKSDSGDLKTVGKNLEHVDHHPCHSADIEERAGRLLKYSEIITEDVNNLGFPMRKNELYFTKETASSIKPIINDDPETCVKENEIVPVIVESAKVDDTKVNDSESKTNVLISIISDEKVDVDQNIADIKGQKSENLNFNQQYDAVEREEVHETIECHKRESSKAVAVTLPSSSTTIICSEVRFVETSATETIPSESCVATTDLITNNSAEINNYNLTSQTDCDVSHNTDSLYDDAQVNQSDISDTGERSINILPDSDVDTVITSYDNTDKVNRSDNYVIQDQVALTSSQSDLASACSEQIIDNSSNINDIDPTVDETNNNENSADSNINPVDEQKDVQGPDLSCEISIDEENDQNPCLSSETSIYEHKDDDQEACSFSETPINEQKDAQELHLSSETSIDEQKNHQELCLSSETPIDEVHLDSLDNAERLHKQEAGDSVSTSDSVATNSTHKANPPHLGEDVTAINGNNIAHENDTM